MTTPGASGQTRTSNGEPPPPPPRRLKPGNGATGSEPSPTTVASPSTASTEPDIAAATPSPQTDQVAVEMPSTSTKSVRPFSKQSLNRPPDDPKAAGNARLVREYGFQPRRKRSVPDGAELPNRYEPVPPALYGRPLEEIDGYIYDETFCVVSKRFKKNYIHRFTATNSFFWFSPFSSARRACIYLSTNQYFDYVVMATILLNCVFLAMTETVEEAEYIFLAIYTAEMLIKSVAKGFILNKYTYLRNPWNWLDFVVITSGYATIGLDMGNLAGLRTFRVLRALKTVSIMPGLKTIINALLHSFKQLAEVMTLTIFCLMVFALFALQVYMGELRNKCVINPPEFFFSPEIYGNVSMDDAWHNWTWSSQNWLLDEEDEPILCGNLTGARHCPENYTCLCVGENPNNGYTNFDNFMWSMLTTFQLITLDYWENVYNMVLASCGPMSVSFFTVVVFFGSFYLINLMLAVVALSYEEEAEITQEERKKDLTEHRDDSTFSFDPSCLDVRKLDKNSQKRIDARKGVLLASYSRKKMRRKKRGRHEGNGGNGNGGRSATPSPSPSPRRDAIVAESQGAPPPPKKLSPEPQQRVRAPQAPRVVLLSGAKDQQERSADTLHPCNALGPQYRGQLGPHSRQASSNNSDGNNRESSLDDSGVVDDHCEEDATSEEHLAPAHVHSVVQLQREVTPVTVALTRKDGRIVRCNGVNANRKKKQQYSLPPEYMSQVVVLDDIPDRNCARCVHCCIDYAGWLQFQQCLYNIVRDPLFELAITICIVLNTMFLAVEHHGMSKSVERALDIGNKVFTSIFTFECFLKILALSKEFFLCGWNIFDLIVVSGSLLDLIFELVDGLSVLRGLRLLRVLKLAQSWTTMKVLLSIIISTIGALGNLTFVLVIVIYIFAVIGMQLFSKDYTPDKFFPDPVPRWNFNDFFHSFMMIFRILCGEWIEPLWDCMRAEEKVGAGSCFAIFLPALVMGNFMVLNLFLALLLNSFNSEELKNKKEEVGEDSKLARSFERIRSIVRKKRSKEHSENEKNTQLEQIVMDQVVIRRRRRRDNVGDARKIDPDTRYSIISTGIPHDHIYSHSYHEALKRPVSGSDFRHKFEQDQAAENASHQQQDKNGAADVHSSQETIKQLEEPCILPEDENPSEKQRLVQKLSFRLTSEYGTQQSDSKDETTESIEMQPLNPTPQPKPQGTPKSRSSTATNTPTPSKKPLETTASSKGNGRRPWLALVSYVDDLTVGGRRDSQGQYTDGMGGFPRFGRNKQPKVPQDCFPQHCYQRCSCWEACAATETGQKWTRMRASILSVVDTPAFEWFILVLIFASSITLCFEDIYLEGNKPLIEILYWTNLAFCLIFTIEMVLKWMAFGFQKYFTSFWTILDFIIVFVSVFSLLIEENENLKVLRSLRTLRALRPLRAISRWQGMRIVVNALMYAIPSIFNVLLVCLVFWLIFSIMGVQFFGGKFFKCLDDDMEILPISIVNDKWECEEKNFTWKNSKITFDHVGAGYLALFQVATFEGWMEVMADAVDARGVDLQPDREANLYAYLYFVIFIVCGSFFTLNLFIGVIIDNFNMLKKRYEGGVLEMFLTESQKHYYTAMKKLGRKKPQKVIKRPINQFLAFFYDISNSRRFEIIIFILIFLNMLTMGIEHYGQPQIVYTILDVSNAFFTTVFSLEAIVKMIGLRWHYFTVPWNLFDFLLVLASILGILMEDIMIDLPVSPTLLRVVRVFRIGRILRLIKWYHSRSAAKGIRKLLFALVVSLPALFNIGALLALITFIYAIIGMSLFGHVRTQGALDDMVNFQTFGRSMQLLFRLMTSAGWNDVLESLMIQPPICDPYYNGLSNGDCGYPLLAITYFTSFIIISYMIVINMYIAIILENFNQAHQEEEIGIVEDDLEMFYIRWSKYDPHATQFIAFSQLSDFIASLDPPLGISKPNTVALVSFNLPIAKGNKIHCLDILHALVKHVLGHVEETEDFRQLQDQMDVKFKKQFPTRKELEIVSSTRLWKREDKAARLIQKTFREYVKWKEERDRDKSECDDEVTQTSSPGGWQGRLSAFLHVHRGSRASSRKSSRASDASDLSELGGAWLNLPLMLLSGAVQAEEDGSGPSKDVSIMVSEPSPDACSPPMGSSLQHKDKTSGRRRSFYNFPFLLKHQDAVEHEDENSPTKIRSKSRSPEKITSVSTEILPIVKRTAGILAPANVDQHVKRGSLIRRRPLERGLSGQLRPSGSCLPVFPLSHTEPVARTPDVSILITEPSPDTAAPSSTMNTPPDSDRSLMDDVGPPPTTIVHALVHRESEEYRSQENLNDLNS